MKEYWIVYTGGIPNRFNTYNEAILYFEECKEWIRDAPLTLTKIVEETIDWDYIPHED